MLGDLCDVRIGRTPSRNRTEYWGPGSPWLSIADMNQGRDLVTTRETITERAVHDCNMQRVQPGTVLLSFKLSIGKVGISRVPMFTNEAIAQLPIRNGEVLAPYLAWALCSVDLGRTDRAAMGATLNIAKLRQIAVPVPPVSEQRRIVDILDVADSLRVQRRVTLANLDAVPQAVFVEMFGDPLSNSKGLPVTTLGQVASFVGGGTPSRQRREFFEGDICWASPKDMSVRVLEDTQEHVTNEGIASSATKLVPIGTVLIVVKSKVLLHRVPLAITRVPTCFSQDIKGIIPGPACRGRFLFEALRAGEGWLLQRARGVNTEGLTLEHLSQLPIALPPLRDQAQFEQQCDAADAVGRLAHRSLQEMDRLFMSIQHRTFGGEL